MKKNSPIKFYAICAVIIFISIYNAYASNNLPEFTTPTPSYEWKNPLPSGNEINDVWCSSSSNVYAVGDKGHIIHYNGSSWSEIESETTESLEGIWGSSATDIFVVGYRKTILHYDGSSWSTMMSDSSGGFLAVHGSSANNVYAVGYSGAIYHYDGSTWTEMTSNTSDYLYGVWANSTNDVFAVGSPGTIMHYNGSTWSAMTSGTTNALYGIFGTSGNNVYAVGSSGTVIQYNGSSWSILSGFSGTLLGVWASSSSDIFISGSSGSSYYYNGSSWSSISTLGGKSIWGSSSSSVFTTKSGRGNVYYYNGSTWDMITTEFEDNSLRSIWKSDDGYYFVTGYYGTFLQYNGTSWSTISSGTSNHISDIWGISRNDLYMCGYSGTILNYNGTSCSTMTSNTSEPLYSIHGTATNNIFIVGSNGTILKYDGSSWSSMTSGTTNLLYSVWSYGSSAYAVGNTGTILYYNGSTWSAMTSNTTNNFRSVWGFDENNIYAGDSNGRIHHYDGSSWAIITGNLGHTFYGIYGANENDIYVTSAYGYLAHFNGVEWSSIEGLTPGLNGIYEKNGLYTIVGDGGTIIDLTTVQVPYQIPDISINEDNSTSESFFIYDADSESVSFSASTSDTTAIPNENITFSISGNYVTMSITPASNETGSITIDIIATDQSGGSSTNTFTMTVSNINDAPTDITLSSDSILENQVIGTNVGDFSTTDVDASDTFSYTFASGTGDIDNSRFTISNNTLQSNEIFDYETDNSYSIRVKTTDNSGANYEKAFTISILDDNESLFIIHPSSTQNQTQPISIPLTLNNMTSTDIMSIELEIGYDSDVLTATGISLTGTVLDNQNYLYVFNTDIPGTIYAVFASSSEIYTETGVLLYIDFTVLGTAGETSNITIVSSRFNNNSATSSDGIFTVAPNAAPTFADILPQTGAEDTPHSFTMTVSDLESNPCDLTLTFESSDESLVPANSVSYTCMSNAYYVTFTPSNNQFGTVSLTITTTDIGNQSSYTIVELTIDSVNDPLTISTIANQTTDEDVPITVTFTTGDIETAPCGFDITLTSSDQSLFVNSNLTYDCQANTYIISLTPETNQSGMATITIVAADSDGMTASTAFDITVTAINDAPQIGSITDQLQYGSAVIEALELTATDIETATCSLGMSVVSSNSVLMPTSNIAYTCASNSFYFTLTPVTGQSGSSTITIVVTDSGGLTASTSFILNINLPPELSVIPHSGTAIGEISFTIVEADGDTVSLTVTSSDQSLISDTAITINTTNSNTTELTTTAEIEQTISISLPQESNVHGLAVITITASAIGGTVSETFNVIVSPPGSGNALTFDGDDDFITFGSIDGSHPLALAGSQFSLAFWIKPAIIGDSFQRIIDKSTAGLAADGYLLCLNTGNSLKFYLNGMARFTTDSNVLTANRWHHVVVTGDASQYKCYVNGIAVGLTTENSFELPPNATANLYIGTWYTESTREYHGQMDEVSIWNVALSETDVRNYMCSRLSGNETGLVAYFRFDHFTGTTLTDLSGNNFHGTLTNMDNASWNISEAPLGDTSINDYIGSVPADFSVTLSHSDGDAFTAFGDSGSYSGLHLYLVDEPPSTYTLPSGFSILYTDHYFGVFPVGTTSTYSVAYDYSGNTSITTDTGLRLAARSNNSSTWFDLSASLNQATTTLSQTGISAFSGISTTEFIPGINNEPIIGAIAAQTINEDGIINSLAITATDAETASCSLNITFNSSDTVLVPVDNISYTCSANTFYLSITPLNNLTGVCNITITLTDAGGLSASGTLALTVADVNDVPLISTITDQTTIEDVAVGSISLTVADIEDAACSMDITITSSDTVLIPNDNISYTCSSNTYWLTITPAADQNGLATITFTVIDSGGLTAAYYFDFTITAVNDAPVLANPISNRIATEGTAYAYTVPSNTFVDVDSGDVLTYTATQENGSALPAWLSFDPSTRAFTGLPTNSDVGSITITITATDGSAQSITDTFVLSVNNTNTAPILDYPIADQTINEDVSYSFTFAANTFHDDDVAFGDTISYTAMLADGSPLPTWLTFDVNSRNFSGTPLNADVGMITITVIAEDTLNLTAMDSFYLTVVNVNDAPEISDIVRSATIISLTGLTIDEDVNADAISFSITDVDDTNLTVTLESSNITLLPLTNIDYTCTNGSCALSLTPVINESGTSIITVTVTDPQGLSASNAFDLTVTAVNDPPEISVISGITINEDTATSANFTITDTETDAANLTVSTASSNQTLVAPENISISGTGSDRTISIMPSESEFGIVVITVSVSDGNLTSTSAFNLTVTAVNDAPVFSSSPITSATQGVEYIYTPTAIDVEGNTIAFSVISKPDWLSIQYRHGNISTVAGTGTAGFSGDNGPAISAQLDIPRRVAVDSFGNIYISDRNNNRIRKIDIATGNISTIAGTGTAAYSGDGGPATSAAISVPLGIAIDSSDNIYFVHKGNDVIRRIDASSGIISTVAGNGTDGYSGDGGPATSAQLSNPYDVAIDSFGNIYITGDSDLIRKVDHTTGYISTIAGTTSGYSGDGGLATSAQLYNPDGIALDSLGNIYIADSNGNRIRKIDASTGIITTIAGDGSAGYSGDGGPAASAVLNIPYDIELDTLDNIYFSDQNNHAIRRIDAQTGIITTFAGTGSSGFSGDGGSPELAQLYSPVGLAIDTYGNIYIADTNNHRIRKIEAVEIIISGTPQNSDVGNHVLTIEVTDGSDSSVQSFTICVANVNDAPAISLISNQTTNEDTATSAISFTVIDADGDSLTVSVSSSNLTLVPIENITLSGTGLSRSVTVTPATNENGIVNITLSVTDGNLTSTTSFQLTVISINDVPTVSAISGQTISEDSTGIILFTAIDVDSADCNMSVTITSSDTSLIPNENITFICDANAYTITAIPATDQNGVATITVTVSDSAGMTSSQSFDLTVTAVNDPPELGTIGGQTIDEDTSVQITLSASDDDSVDCNGLDITIVTSNTGLVPDENISYTCGAGSMVISLTPISNLSGMLSITVTISDAYNLSAVSTFDLTVTSVNDTPVIGFISDQSTIEDVAIGSITLTAVDLEDTSSSMDITITSSDTGLIPNENISYTCISNTYWLSITPAADQNGIATITVTIADSGGLSALRSFDLTVTAINDAPILANPISNRIATEGTPYEYTIPSNTFVDIDLGDILTYTATQFNGSALPEWLIFNPATHVFSGLPNNSDVGMITITITATDGSAQSITNTFVLNVNNTNNSPVVDNPIADQTISEDVAYTFTFAANTFRDDDAGDTISYSATFADGSALPSWLAFDSNTRTFSGTPLNADVGMFTITVFATDTLGMTATDSFYLTVVNVNDAPEITSISNQTINEDTIAGPLSFTVTDVDNSNLSVLATSSALTLVTEMNISISGTASARIVVITPTAHANGETLITLSVTDGSLTSTTTFTLIVTPVNDIPVISSISDQIMDEDSTIDSITYTASDVETAPCGLTMSLESSNSNILPDITYSCFNNNYTITAIPAANQNGIVTVTVTATDSEGMTATQSFFITINPINDGPVVGTVDSQHINEGESLSFTLTATDIEGDALTITATSMDQNLVSDSNIGVVNDGDVYTITVTPNEYQIGNTDITLSVSDGTDTTLTTFTITVNELNYIIAGHIASYTDIAFSGIQNATLTLSGTYTYTTTTDISGNYSFSTVRPGDYTLTVSKTDEISLDIADAIKILKATVRLINLTCYEQIAADASMNGRFGAYDAAKVALYVSGRENCLNDDCVFWLFIPEELSSCETWPLIEIENTRRYTDLSGDALGQDFIGIGSGNVSE